MTTVTIEAVEGHLKEIIAALNPGDELVIVQDGEPVAKLARTPPKPWPCEAGCYQKAEFWMASDFDAPLDEFREYME
jgi:antitoxin (DNA-binding transcriptional repressor) of toxin-antitoxin stability system